LRGGEGQREGENPEADSLLSAELGAGLDPGTLRPCPELKLSQLLNPLSHPGAPVLSLV